jgi:hypothetical protein
LKESNARDLRQLHGLTLITTRDHSTFLPLGFFNFDTNGSNELQWSIVVNPGKPSQLNEPKLESKLTLANEASAKAKINKRNEEPNLIKQEGELRKP